MSGKIGVEILDLHRQQSEDIQHPECKLVAPETVRVVEVEQVVVGQHDVRVVHPLSRQLLVYLLVEPEPSPLGGEQQQQPVQQSAIVSLERRDWLAKNILNLVWEDLVVGIIIVLGSEFFINNFDVDFENSSLI